MGGQNNISLTSSRALATGTSLANVDPATDAQGDYEPRNRSHSRLSSKRKSSRVGQANPRNLYPSVKVEPESTASHAAVCADPPALRLD